MDHNSTPDMTLVHILLVVGSAGVVTIVLNIVFWMWRRNYRNKIADTYGSNMKLTANLHDERAKSQIILNTIEDGVMLIDNNQVIQLFNPGASTITGWQTGEALGLDYKAVVKLVDAKGNPYTPEQDPIAQAFGHKKNTHDNHASVLSRSNKQTSLDISVSILPDVHGQPGGAVCVFRDVSEARSEEQRRAEFISTASHEMRTPVAAIEGYLALALNARVSTIDNKARQFLEKAHASTEHLGKLFQDLLTSAKAEDGRLASHPAVVEVGAFVENLIEDLKFAATKKGLHVELVTGSGNQIIDASKGAAGNLKVLKPLYHVYADPDRIREVITNLFDNATKYTESGTISVGLTGNSKVVQLYVRDTGPGIPPEDLPHLFQKFYRIDNSATRTIGGTGLGLFICSKIIDLYQGRIWVESELGKGSTFYIDLPRLDNKKAAELQAAASQTLTTLT